MTRRPPGIKPGSVRKPVGPKLGRPDPNQFRWHPTDVAKMVEGNALLQLLAKKHTP